MDAVLIPAYEPDEELVKLTQHLKEAGFAIVVVDDGSGPDYRAVFDAVSQDAQVLRHAENRGKGAALKTGMRHIREHMPDVEHFITCDADGQHRVEDVVRVSRQLEAGHKFVLTMRNRRTDIPLRSKVGNLMSRVVYALLTKRYLSDNQSGLRGFSRDQINWLVEVEKDNYDYEMNVLYYAAKKAVPIFTIPIEAIYINNNQSSHFQPVKDTIRIYKSLFSLAIGQFAGLFMTLVLVLVASLLFGYQHLLFTVPGSGIISYGIHMLVDRCFTFRSTHCHDQLTLLIHQIISHTLYTLGCMLCFYTCPQLPLWLAFGIVFLLCLPLRYWLYKFTFIALRTAEQ